MSGANADCHVSTKWEDTGGKDNTECDSNVLFTSSNTNGDSLQELIEKEFALRSSAVMNGVDRSSKDNGDDGTDEEKSYARDKADVFDIIDVVTPVNGCKRSNSFKLTRGVAVAEVDDFDVLYSEVSDDELVSNGNVTLTGLLSPELELSIASSLSDDKSEGKRDVEETNESEASTYHEVDSVKAQLLTSFSDETESSLDSVRVACGSNKSVDVIPSFESSAANSTNNDFIPISEVDIVVDEQEEDGTRGDAGDHSQVSMTSMIDVQKVVECMEDSRHVIDGNDPIENAQESGNQRKNNDNYAAIAVTTSDVVSNTAEECHYQMNNVTDCRAVEQNDCDAPVSRNGDVTDDARDVLVLAEGCELTGDRTDSEIFEKGFERWTIETSNLAVIAATTNGLPQEVDECSCDLTMSSDVVAESNTEERKNVKKKKSTAEESVTAAKTKKTKKTKKYEEKENISVTNELKQNGLDDPNFHQIVDDGDELSNVCVRDLRSGFGKFDQLTKKTVMHVRSSDATKAPQQFSQNDASQDSGNRCKACNKNVFAMEQIKAERHVWHKNCFRCKTCNKQLTVDGYSSHEGELFCKPHFRDLFKPKTVIEDEQPTSDKPDLGLEELSSLNVKSRFQVFEKAQVEETTDKSPVSVKRSPSILSKLAKFQAKGMDVGVSSDIFNGIDYEESSSSEDEEHAPDDNITRSTVVKEKPIAFNNMNDVKKNWENGQATRKEERLEQRREELQNIRSRLFQGKQNRMKEAYEHAVAESEKGNVKKDDVEIRSEKARSIKEKFEKGEILPTDDSDTEQDKKTSTQKDDMDVFDAGISKQSRSLFQQMDAAMKTQSQSNVATSPTPPMQNGHRSFKESESPERDVQKNPDVVRCDDQIDDGSEVLKKSNTTSKMLSIFRQMETAHDTVPDGPRPMKKFTPPPQSRQNSESESEEESSEASNPNDDIIRASDKTEDEYLIMAQKAAKAKALKEKFEKWEPERQLSGNAINLLESEEASLDSAKSIRDRFESMKAEQPTDKPRPKVNRFVEKSLPGFCDGCLKTVYPLEKVEAGDKVFHRSCFKCSRCHGILRMETFTMNNGHLYCVTHFKQLFIAKGNYDEGFGNHQHKAKWPVHTGLPVANGIH